MVGNIYLAGFMGAGKTTVGRLLAERLDLPFFDLDQVIVEETGRSIPELFASRGQTSFRVLEARTLRRLSGPAVIALGGGAFHVSAIRAYIRETGRSIFLDWSFETLYARIANDPDRPLARDQENVRSLFEKRYPIYLTADLVWRSQPPYTEPPERVAEDLEQRLKRPAPE